MEYNLLKTIESSIGGQFVPNETYPRLSAYPANDFVNPGLGQICRLHEFYVPLYAQPNLHAKQKKEPLENLEGSGNDEKAVENVDQITTEDISDQMKEDPIEFNLEKRKRLGSAIHDSFLHPKLIKTDLISLKKPNRGKKPKETVITPKAPVKHKFKFLDD